MTAPLGFIGAAAIPYARAATAHEVTREAEIVIAAIPRIAHTDLPTSELAGRVVLDTSHSYPQRDGQIRSLVGRTSAQPTAPSPADTRQRSPSAPAEPRLSSFPDHPDTAAIASLQDRTGPD